MKVVIEDIDLPLSRAAALAMFERLASPEETRELLTDLHRSINAWRPTTRGSEAARGRVVANHAAQLVALPFDLLESACMWLRRLHSFPSPSTIRATVLAIAERLGDKATSQPKDQVQ